MLVYKIVADEVCTCQLNKDGTIFSLTPEQHKANISALCDSAIFMVYEHNNLSGVTDGDVMNHCYQAATALINYVNRVKVSQI